MATTYYYTEPELVATADPNNPLVGAAADAFFTILDSQLRGAPDGIKQLYFLYSVAGGAATAKTYDLIVDDGKVKVGNVWFDALATNVITYAVMAAIGIEAGASILLAAGIASGVSLLYSAVQNYAPTIYDKIAGTAPIELKLLDEQNRHIGGTISADGLGGNTKPLIANAIYDMLDHRAAASYGTMPGMSVQVFQEDGLLARFQILGAGFIDDLANYFGRSSQTLFGNDVDDPLSWTDGQFDGYQLFFDADNPVVFVTPQDRLSLVVNLLRPAHEFYVQDIVTDSYLISGNGRANLLLGKSGASNVLSGGGGNDVLLSRGQHDSLVGGEGSDELYAGAGNDTLDGGGGIDWLYGEAGNDTFVATLRAGGADKDHYNGADGLDTIDLSKSLVGVALSLGANAEVAALVANTVIAIDAGGTARGGRDILQSVEAVIGTDFADVLVGSDGSNSLFAGVGNDRFLPSLGSDVIDGGGGIDTADYSGAGFDFDITTLDAALGHYRIRKSGTLDSDRLFSIENLIGKKVTTFEPAGGTVIQGTAQDDSLSRYSQSGSTAGPFTFKGLGGHDGLSGSAANDRFEGGPGNDTMTGLRGNDVFFYAKGDGNDWISANGTGADSAYQSDQLVFGPGITRADLTFSRGASNDVVIALSDGSKITLVGQLNAPVDFIRFASGDIIDMETQLVPAFGTEGNDVINDVPEQYGEREGALVSERMYGYGGDDTLNAGNGLNTVYGGAGNDNISGGADADTLFGEGDVDRIAGGSGDDSLSGGDGDDAMIAGDDGNDTLSGGAGRDSLLGAAGNDVLSGDAGNDTLSAGTGNDSAAGGGGNDTIAGDSGDDTLSGGANNDTLNGGAGNDLLSGGAGRDRFEFTNNPGSDIILGFETTLDIIALKVSPSLNAFSKLDIYQDGADTVINLNSTTLTLADYLRTDLTAAQFDFA